jgi:hypothetical protein
LTPRSHPSFPLAPRTTITLPAVLVFCAVLCLGWAPGAAGQDELPVSEANDTWTPSQAGPMARVAAILDQDFQTELPDPAPAAEEADRRKRRGPTRVLLPNIMVKIGLILGGVLVLAVILNLFFSTDRWADRDDPATNGNDAFDLERLDLGDPDRLAADGRYADAIHAMLLRALALSAGRLELTWPHSLTSREILGSASLTDQARESLNDLVTRVEIHHFGGRPPRAEDFHHCRLVYERLAADPIRGRA